MDLKDFRAAGVFEMLLYLSNNERGARRVDMRTEMKINPATATKAMRIMLMHGLCTEIMYDDANVVILTAIGKEVAEHVAKSVYLVSKLPENFHMLIEVKKEKFKVDTRT